MGAGDVMAVKQQIRLDYGRLGARSEDEKQKLIKNISAVVQAGRHLWTASDEGRTVECLTWTGKGFGEPRSFALKSYFKLPKTDFKEIDLEGLAISAGRLWVCGSHSLVRCPAKPNKAIDCPGTDPLERLTHIRPRPR